MANAAAGLVAEGFLPPRMLRYYVNRAAESGVEEGELFSRRFLLRRPLLEALEHDGPVVLLIDEVDRADDEFEAFLLEFLSDFAVTIPELGTITALHRPVVVLTSNRTRELHDALKRRCLYHWIDYPNPERERAIVQARIPGVPDAIIQKVSRALITVTKDPGLKANLARLGSYSRSMDVAQAIGFAHDQQEMWAPVLKQVAAKAK